MDTTCANIKLKNYKSVTFKMYETYATSVPEGTIIVDIENHTSLRELLSRCNQKLRIAINVVCKDLGLHILPPVNYAEKIVNSITNEKKQRMGLDVSTQSSKVYRSIYAELYRIISSLPDGDAYISTSDKCFVVLTRYESKYYNRASVFANQTTVESAYRSPEFLLLSASDFAKKYKIEYKGNFCNIDMQIYNQLRNRRTNYTSWIKCRYNKDCDYYKYVAKPKIISTPYKQAFISHFTVLTLMNDNVVDTIYMRPEEFAHKVDLRNWSKESGYLSESNFSKPVEIM